ncbi:hypothetical protein ES703_99263 [subsurface metagenome]
MDQLILVKDKQTTPLIRRIAPPYRDLYCTLLLVQEGKGITDFENTQVQAGSGIPDTHRINRHPGRTNDSAGVHA